MNRGYKMRHRHKREDYDFRQLKDATTAPPVERARGGRTGDPAARQEAGNHDRHASKDPLTAHTKSRPAHRTKKKAVEMSGQPPRHRGDRPNRKGRAAGGRKTPWQVLAAARGMMQSQAPRIAIPPTNVPGVGPVRPPRRQPRAETGGRVSRPKRFDDGGAAGSTRPSDPGNEIAAANKGRKSTADWIRARFWAVQSPPTRVVAVSGLSNDRAKKR